MKLPRDDRQFDALLRDALGDRPEPPGIPALAARAMARAHAIDSIGARAAADSSRPLGRRRAVDAATGLAGLAIAAILAVGARSLLLIWISSRSLDAASSDGTGADPGLGFALWIIAAGIIVMSLVVRAVQSSLASDLGAGPAWPTAH